MSERKYKLKHEEHEIIPTMYESESFILEKGEIAKLILDTQLMIIISL